MKSLHKIQDGLLEGAMLLAALAAGVAMFLPDTHTGLLGGAVLVILGLVFLARPGWLASAPFLDLDPGLPDRRNWSFRAHILPPPPRRWSLTARQTRILRGCALAWLTLVSLSSGAVLARTLSSLSGPVDVRSLLQALVPPVLVAGLLACLAQRLPQERPS